MVFDNQYLPRVIKYIWSAGLPVGISFINPLYGRGRVVVLRSGSSSKGEWHQEIINWIEKRLRSRAFKHRLTEPGLQKTNRKAGMKRLRPRLFRLLLEQVSQLMKVVGIQVGYGPVAHSTGLETC